MKKKYDAPEDVFAPALKKTPDQLKSLGVLNE